MLPATNSFPPPRPVRVAKVKPMAKAPVSPPKPQEIDPAFVQRPKVSTPSNMPPAGCKYHVGDHIDHASFGPGRVVSWSGDILTMAFDSVGTRYMLYSISQHFIIGHRAVKRETDVG